MNNSSRVLAQVAEEELKAPISNRSGDGVEVEVTIIPGGDDEEEKLSVVGLSEEDAVKADDEKSGKETATMLSSSDSEAGSGNNDDTSTTKKPESNSTITSEEKNPWTLPYVGIPINYFSVGVILGGSVSVLYPILIIQNGVTSSFYSAASSLVTLFWSYKIIFGIICDCFPIRGQKWKPYIILGWGLCAAMLVVLAGLGKNVSPTNLVVMLTFANLG